MEGTQATQSAQAYGGVPVKVGIVGATGQVGTVMRKILAERTFPAERAAAVRLGPVRGVHDRLAGPGDHGRGRRHRRLLRPGHRALLGRRRDLQGARREGRLPGRRRDRQLLRLAPRPGGAAGGLRGQPARDQGPPQGHHRQPELHDHGRDARPEAPPPGGGPRRPGRHDLPGRVRLGPRGRRRARRPGRRPSPTAPPRSPTTARPSTSRSPASTSAPSPSTSSRSPARSSTTAPTRRTRSRSSATSPARSWRSRS